MPTLTPQQKRRAEKLVKLMKNGELAILEYLSELEEKLDLEIPSIKDLMSRVKGDKGDAYNLTTEDKQEIIKVVASLINPDDLKGNPGEKGDKGDAYILTAKDKTEIAKSIKVPVIDRVIEKTEVIRETPIIKEVAVADPPVIIRDKLETLINDARLDKSAIKGLEDNPKLSDAIINRAIGIIDQRTSFLINKVSNLSDKIITFSSGGVPDGTTITGTGTVADPIKLNLSNSNTWLTNQTIYGILDVLNNTSTGFMVRRSTDSNPAFIVDTASLTSHFYGGVTIDGTITGTSFIIGANTLDTNEWAYLDGQDQAVKTTSIPQFAGLKSLLNATVRKSFQFAAGATIGAPDLPNLLIGSYDTTTALTSGYGNIYLGVNDTFTFSVRAGSGNMCIGSNAGRVIRDGLGNICIGYQSGFAIQDGQYNVCLGTNAGVKLVGTYYNIAIGGYSLIEDVSSHYNAAIGYNALKNTTSASSTAIGYSAGYTNTSGASNVFIGANAGYYATAGNLLIIDNQTRTNATTEATSCLIYGVFNATVASQTLSLNAVVTTPYTSIAAYHQTSTAPTANSTGTVAIVAKDANLLTNNAGWLPLKKSDGTVVYVPYWA